MKSKLLAGAAGIAAIGIAIAAHYGTFNCGSACTLDGATPDPETASFIASTINQKVNQWKAKDTVTVCNDRSCATYLMASVMGGIPGMQQISKVPRGGGSGGPGGGGGSGGGSGGGWSGVGGGGCFGECGGKVVVGPVSPPKAG
ncbi:hypothetical protein [Pseudomonas sp. CGJS7]|uniref:hypothetical protein n=1 Tax=Pseudomonas sp. CGJS7 TaxID=3109348 RepID=UPI003009DAE0